MKAKDAACYSLRELVRLAQRHENPEDKIPIPHTVDRWFGKISHPEIFAEQPHSLALVFMVRDSSY